MIEMKNISYSYSEDDDFALKDVSLTIPEGKWISILGHNGSGKSTLAKIMMGLIKANKGTILIDDIELTEQTVDELRKKIGIVFQNPDNQFVGVTVKNDIAFGLENRLITRDEMLKLVDDASKKVGLEGQLDKEPYKLSGGQKQRVAIAGIIAMNAKYIIFDEATSMLDPKGVRDVTALIKELKQDKTIITITHDLELASLSDEIYVFKNGKITAHDIPANIFRLNAVLNDSNLEVPFELALLNEVKKDSKLKYNKRLGDALCQLSSKM